jgi:hypothetical protein
LFLLEVLLEQEEPQDWVAVAAEAVDFMMGFQLLIRALREEGEMDIMGAMEGLEQQ